MAREDQFSRLVLAAEPRPFWLDQPGAPPAREPLRGEAAADLVVIGAGFTGLWTALLAKESDPERSVVLVEGHRIGWAASGRNGGFCDASLTHGAANGRERFPGEFATLQRLGAENLDAIQIALDRHGIDCEFERTGSIAVATEDYQVDKLRDVAEDDGVAFLDASAMRAEVNSPTYLAGVWDKQGTALVQPARLAWGLAAACERLGVAYPRGHARHRPGQRRGRRERPHPGRGAAGRPGGPGHERVSRAAAPAAALHRAGLRLRPGDRAAQRGAAGRDRLAQPAGHRRFG